MVSRGALDEYGAANNGIVAMAQKDLVDFWKLLDKTNPLEVKAAMLEFMPELISAYGESASVLAADFYESVRPSGLPPFQTVMADLPPLEQVEAVTRYNIDPVFKGEPDAALSHLASAVQRLVNQPARDTIAKNADRDPSGASWARVPMGKTTCSFCRMLASRGAAYGSKASASAKRNGSKYHDDCDCKPVPMWSKADYPEGYDPDELYDEYASAHEPGMSTKETLSTMRKQTGEFVTAIAAPVAPVGKLTTAALSGQSLADTVTYHSTLHMSDGDLAEMMSKHADDPAVFDKIMEVMDERDAKYMTVQTKATGAAIKSLDEKPPAPIKLDPSPTTNPAARKPRNLSQREVASEEYQNYAMAQYSRALDDLNGVLLNAKGKAHAQAAGGFDLSMNIFSGSAVTARKYASEELLGWWEEQGRETLGSFRYKLYGWDTDRKAAQTVRNMGYERGQAFRDRSQF
jgi:hypothetical protein